MAVDIEVERPRDPGRLAGSASLAGGDGATQRERDSSLTAPDWPLTPTQPPITQGDIGTASVQTGQILDGSVTKDKQAPSQPDNVVEDPSFEQEQTRLKPQGATFDDTVADHGTWSLKFTGDGAMHEYRPTQTYTPCIPGDRIAIKVRYRHSGSVTDGLWVTIEYDGAAQSDGGPAAINDGVWRTYESVRTVPAGARGFRLLLWDDDAAGSAWADSVEVRILRTWRTADSGARVEMDFSGIRLYNSSNALTVELDATTGDATFIGDIVGGSLRVQDSDPGNSTYVYIADDFGIRWRAESGDEVVAFLQSSKSDSGATHTQQLSALIAPDATSAPNADVSFSSFTSYVPGSSNGGVGQFSIGAKAPGTSSKRAELLLKSENPTGTGGATAKAGFWFQDPGAVGIPYLFFDTDPADNSIGNSRYAAGVRGSSWFVEKTADSDTANSTTYVDWTGCSVTFTAIAGRRYRLSAHGRSAVSTVGGSTDIVVWAIREGSTTLAEASGPRLTTANIGEGITGVRKIWTPSAGSHTIKVSLKRAAGSGVVKVEAASDRPVYLLVEDIGY